MSGDSYYFGDNVNMHGGRGNTGIVKNQAVAADAAAVSPALQSAVEELLQLVEELRDRVPPASAQAIDESLADISADDGAPPQDRHRALMAIAGIAATVGVVGQPVLDAVNKILELLGAR
ncbi:hypothetical protein [Streptomyces sp. NBC_01363]|uniref:hypothetical protein n=1 Tax=Streptomyces sp. NBC_01363 TaxID=2903840 RepID=UPI0022570827|nr:hypothetical protein [Streptomyces sp. NBC_01363]MCX4730732.1 hypothetical protein [Streptomyces sp. NBC_01363]